RQVFQLLVALGVHGVNVDAGERLALGVHHLAAEADALRQREDPQLAAFVAFEAVRRRGVLLRQDPEDGRARRDHHEAETTGGLGAGLGERAVLERLARPGRVGVSQDLDAGGRLAFGRAHQAGDLLARPYLDVLEERPAAQLLVLADHAQGV